MGRALPAVLPLAILAASACRRDEADGVIALHALGSRLEVSGEGTLRLLRPDGAESLVGATARVVLDALGEEGRELSMDDPRELAIARSRGTDRLGIRDRVEVRRVGDEGEPDLIWTITAYPYRGAYTFRIAVDDAAGDDLLLVKTSPLFLDGYGGGLFLGADPARHRILENGSYGVLDFVAEVRPGDTPCDEAYAALAPGDFRGCSVSNWDHAIVDLDSEAVWVAGALSVAHSAPVLQVSHESSRSTISEDGREGFTYYAAESAYLPEGKPVPAGTAFASETFWVHPAEPDAQRGLEHFADAAAIALGIAPWNEREAGRRVPQGWNSWSGSGSTGGYGTDIDEATILANLDVMDAELADWGFEWFQVDDGYEPRYGDWTWNPERFPSGPAHLSGEIRARGLRPGLWIAPFTLDPASETAQAHPEWLAEKTTLGQVAASGYEILDLTDPGAQAWLRALVRTFRQDWGFEWLKLDFGYYALFGTEFDDPAATREEAWADAMGIVREELGEDGFLLAIGPIGLDWPLADGQRTTLDNMPIWDWQPGLDAEDHLEQQGFKPTVRTAGRRWYLNGRIWVGHPDLLFFRSNPNDLDWPRLTFEESRAFATFVGLSGGIVKLGDRLVDLEPAAIDVIRRLVPVLGEAARPVDLFAREFPEVWHLPVRATEDGFDEDYDLLGLFDWGSNVDLGVEPFAEIPDDGLPRQHAVDLDALGLSGERLAYEFWTGEFLGTGEGTLAVEVPSHDARVVALREPREIPQFLGWNRQISMGGTLLEAPGWDAAARRLTLRFDAAAPTTSVPFVYEIALYLPEGFDLADLTVDGVATGAVETSREGRVLRIRFAPEATGNLELVAVF